MLSFVVAIIVSKDADTERNLDRRRVSVAVRLINPDVSSITTDRSGPSNVYLVSRKVTTLVRDAGGSYRLFIPYRSFVLRKNNAFLRVEN